MIKDHINNAHHYDDLHPNFRSVLEILQSLNLDALQPGHIELDGKYVYININETKSKSETEAKLESHRKYIDIQMPLSGSETFGVGPTSECVKPIVCGVDARRMSIIGEEDNELAFIQGYVFRRRIFVEDDVALSIKFANRFNTF